MATKKPAIKGIRLRLGQPIKPEGHLWDSLAFRLAIGIPIAIGIILIASIVLTENLRLDLSSEGFSNFLKTFKLPIAIMGLSIPFGALVASQHRSVQSASQIKAQLEQNSFSNFIEHRKLFEDFFNKNRPFRDIKVIGNPWGIYEYLYSNSKQGDLAPVAGYSKIITTARELTKLHSEPLKRSIAMPATSVWPTMAFMSVIMLRNDILQKMGCEPEAEEGEKDISSPLALLDAISDLKTLLIGIKRCAEFCIVTEEKVSTKEIDLINNYLYRKVRKKAYIRVIADETNKITALANDDEKEEVLSLLMEGFIGKRTIQAPFYTDLFEAAQFITQEVFETYLEAVSEHTGKKLIYDDKEKKLIENKSKF